jgi:hypothetical protein
MDPVTTIATGALAAALASASKRKDSSVDYYIAGDFPLPDQGAATTLEEALEQHRQGNFITMPFGCGLKGPSGLKLEDNVLFELVWEAAKRAPVVGPGDLDPGQAAWIAEMEEMHLPAYKRVGDSGVLGIVIAGGTPVYLYHGSESHELEERDPYLHWAKGTKPSEPPLTSRADVARALMRQLVYHFVFFKDGTSTHRAVAAQHYADAVEQLEPLIKLYPTLLVVRGGRRLRPEDWKR